MPSLLTEIHIQAPPAQVWQVLLDFPAYAAWNPFVLSIKGEARVGATLENTLLFQGKEQIFKPKITQLEPERHFEWLGSGLGGTFKGRHYFRLEKAEENQTRFVHGEHFSGILSYVLIPLIGKATEKQFQAMNEALKKRVEEPTS